MRWLSALLLAMTLTTSVASAQGDTGQTVLHMLDYVAVDYSGAVANGKITSEDEYKEMLEFSSQAVTLIRSLAPNPKREALIADAERLAGLVQKKASPRDVAAAAGNLRWSLIGAYGMRVAPKAAPDLARGATLYQQSCAACHGAQGRGDGPAGAKLNPAPSNFHDAERMAMRSVYGLYNTITLGVDGTAMAAYRQLNENDRWALAFHVAGLAADSAARERGEKLWKEGAQKQSFPDLASLSAISSGEMRDRHGADAVAVREYLIAHPDAILRDKPSPVAFARQQIAVAVEAYRKGDKAAAQHAAVKAYLEGFELIESSLANVDSDLMHEGEKALLTFREMIRTGAAVGEVEKQAERASSILERARTRLEAGSLSAGTVFTSSLIILLREGLEALLVVAAIIAFLVKAGRRDALRWVHAGWISAIVLGLATWVVASYMIDISGAQREVTEGVTGLVAAGMLIYVGFWLHNKASSQAWQSYITNSVGAALASRTLWTMAVVSFLAVYREMFETVLFYQALWVQAGEGGRGALAGGFVAAAVALAAIGWGIFRYSLRLPLGPFFGAMSVLMCVLAVILAGKGMAALQEAGYVAATSVDIGAVPMLGIYPTVQSLGTQLVTVIVIVIGYYLSGREPRGGHPAQPARQQQPS